MGTKTSALPVSLGFPLGTQDVSVYKTVCYIELSGAETGISEI